MNISIEENKINFTFENDECNISIINAIRRELMNGIKLYALHSSNAEVYSNISSFYTDFLLKNRLSLMPLIYDNIRNKKIEMHLCKDGELNEPFKNETRDIISVTLNDFIIYEVNNEGKKTKIKNEDVFVYPTMEILWLKPQQQIHLKYRELKEGNGYEHAMYQGFRVSKYETTGSNRYGEPSKISMVMESLGRIKEPKDALFIVLNILSQKIENIKKNIMNVASGTNIIMIDERYMQVTITNETFTLNNIIKHYIMTYLDEISNYSSDFTNLFNVSCNQIHPLKTDFKLQIQLYESFNPEIQGEKEFKKIITNACERAIKDINTIISVI